LLVSIHKTDWLIREATEDDFTEIRNLYHLVWGHLRPEKYDRWRYFSSPLGPSQISLAVKQNRLVGAFMLGPVEVRIGNSIVKGAHAMDVMSHPDYVGRPVFIEAGKHCVETATANGFEVFYGFPNPLSFPGFVRRLNWDHTGDVTHWVRPIRPSGYSKIPAAFGPIADYATHLLPKGRTRHFDIRIQKLGADDLVPLIKTWRREQKLCRVERNEAWFNWRYSSDTLSDYEWVCAYENGDLQALAIWGIRSRKWGAIYDGRARLTELLGINPHALQAVLKTVIKRARYRKAILLETAMNPPGIEKILRRAGFYAHRRMPLIVRSLSNINISVNIHYHPNWQIYGGDVDTF